MLKNIYLPSNLKYLRLEHNKTLDDIAKYMDKTNVAVHYWENGKRDMYAEDLWKIALYYGVDIDDLVFKDLRMNNNAIDNTLQSKINTLTDEQKQKVIDMIDIIK